MWNSMKTAPHDGQTVWLCVRLIHMSEHSYVVPARYDTWNVYFRRWPDGTPIHDEDALCWAPFSQPVKPSADAISAFAQDNSL